MSVPLSLLLLLLASGALVASLLPVVAASIAIVIALGIAVVVNTMWLNYAGLGVSDFEGHVSPAYRSYDFRIDVERRYFHHLMRSSIYVQGYTRLLTGIRPNHLDL